MSLNDRALYFFYNNIFLTFQLVGALILQDFSTYRLISVAMAAFCDFLLRCLLLQLHDKRNLRNIRGFLNEFPTCRFQEMPIEKMIPSEAQKALQFQISEYHKPLKQWLRVFCITKERSPGLAVKRPSTDLSFLGSSSASIFLTSKPAQMGPQQRFRFLHELGHVSWTAKLLAYRELFLGIPFVQMLPWWIFQYDANAAPKWFFVVLSFFLVLLQVLQFPTQVLYDALNESVADNFALTYLSHDERVDLADYMLEKFERRFPFDLKLFTFNKIRAKNLREKLTLIKEERETNLQFTMNPVPHSFLWWIGPALIILFAFLSVPVSGAQILGLSIITVCLAVAAIIVLFLKRNANLGVKKQLCLRINEGACETPEVGG